jgi:hypothetical protein
METSRPDVFSDANAQSSALNDLRAKVAVELTPELALTESEMEVKLMRRLDMTERILRSTSVSRPSGDTIDEAVAGAEVLVSGGEGVSYSCIFFSRI